MASPALKPQDTLAPCDPQPGDEPSGVVFRLVEQGDGSVDYRGLPLTLERLLYPREGDKVTYSDFHTLLLSSLFDRLRRGLKRRTGVAVFSDLLFVWDQPGLRPSGPDLAVVRGFEGDRRKIKGRFDVAAEGVRPCLVIEIVSPEHGRLRSKDFRENLRIYAEAEVDEYLIVDPVRLASTEPLRLLGYRLGGGGFQAIEADAEGAIVSETTGLRFRPDGRDVIVSDTATGERILSADEEAEARREAEVRASTAEAEIARLRAELERRSS